MSGSTATFQTFPPGGGLYRVHWAGRLIPPKDNSETPRIGVWLHQVIQDSNGKYIAEPSSVEADKPLLVYLPESMGSVPAIAIDTYWRDGRPVQPPFRVAQPVDFHLSSESWEIVRASDFISQNSRKRWVNSDEYCLSGFNAARQHQTLYSSRLVVARTKEGVFLLIPTYEVFRAYFAGCTELALQLMDGPLIQAAEGLGTVRKVTTNGQTHLEVEVASHITEIATRYLALFLGTDHGKFAAAEIYSELLQQKQSNESATPWIVVRPPFPSGQTIKLGVCGKWLDPQAKDRFLVYRISHSPFPIIPLPVIQVKDKQHIPILDPTNVPQGEDPKPRPRTNIVSVGLEIGAPSDAKKTKKAAHIDSVAVAWQPETLPKIERQAKEKHYFPRPPPLKGTTITQPSPISVGNRSSNSSTPRASISPEGIEQIVSRFGAFHRCLQTLLNNESIAAWKDYALVRKQTVQGRDYCAFIEEKEADKASYPYWPVIFKPSQRSRLAWVVQIEYEGETVYWMEIEPREKKKPHYALVFMPAEAPLKEAVLERLLTFCANSGGRLPQYVGYGLEDVLIWRRASHRIENDMHKPKTALSSIKGLLHMKRTGMLKNEDNIDD